MHRLFIFLVFLGVGVPFVFAGLASRPTIPDGWVTGEAVVVDFEAFPGRNGNPVYAPIVEFVDRSGASHRLTSNEAASGTLAGKVGDRLAVAWDPQRPDDARITGGIASWAWLLFVVGGLVFAGVGGVGLLIGLRRGIGPSGGDMRPGPGSRSGRGPGPGANLRMAPSRQLSGSTYVFARARARILLDLVIAPAMALMFAAFAILLSGQGAPIWIAFALGAVLLVGSSAASLRHGATPAVEVGPAGIWIRGAGQFAWPELATVRVESFVTTGGRRGSVQLVRHRRLGVVPVETRRANPVASIARAYFGTIMPMLGRRPIELAQVGVGDDEVVDFDALVERVRTYHEVGAMSDDPGTGSPQGPAALV